MLVILIHMFGKSYCACCLGRIRFQWLDTGPGLRPLQLLSNSLFFLTGTASLESELSSDDYNPTTLAIFGISINTTERNSPQKKSTQRSSTLTVT